MSLDDIYMPPIRIDGSRVRRVERLGEWPAIVPLTPLQLAQRRWARDAQVGQAKAANRVKR